MMSSFGLLNSYVKIKLSLKRHKHIQKHDFNFFQTLNKHRMTTLYLLIKICLYISCKICKITSVSDIAAI